jgi:hypothetical protein
VCRYRNQSDFVRNRFWLCRPEGVSDDGATAFCKIRGTMCAPPADMSEPFANRAGSIADCGGGHIWLVPFTRKPGDDRHLKQQGGTRPASQRQPSDGARTARRKMPDRRSAAYLASFGRLISCDLGYSGPSSASRISAIFETPVHAGT